MAITCLSTVAAANQPTWRKEKEEEDTMYSGVWEGKKDEENITKR